MDKKSFVLLRKAPEEPLNGPCSETYSVLKQLAD